MRIKLDGTPQKTSRPKIDWISVEREYRAGQLPVKELARVFGCSVTGLQKHAAKCGWTRGMKDRIRARAEAKLSMDSSAFVDILPSGKISSYATLRDLEEDAIEMAAARQVEIVRGHRKALMKMRGLCEDMLEELADKTINVENLRAAIELDPKFGEPRRKEEMRSLALETRAKVMVDLTNAMKTAISMENEAFGISSAAEEKSQNIKINVVNYDSDRSDDSAQVHAERVSDAPVEGN